MKIAVIGGDRRMTTVARLFREAGIECATAATGDTDIDVFEAIKESAVTVLPLPCQKDGKLNAPASNKEIYVGDLYQAGKGKTLFVGGNIPTDWEYSADYSLREDFLLKNAVLTAEGAIESALRATDFSLFGANAAVFGFGRIGARLASLLNAFGAKTTVVARRQESRVLAEMSNHRAVGFDKKKEVLNSADIVFNTVPFQIFEKSEIALLENGSVFIELASAPYGIREEDAKLLGSRLIRAGSLPGKTAFESAGRIIFESVTEIMREKGMTV